MICDTCAVEMNATTTQREVAFKKKVVKAINVPAMTCPQCGRVEVEWLVERIVRKLARRCPGGELDFSEQEGPIVLGIDLRRLGQQESEGQLE